MKLYKATGNGRFLIDEVTAGESELVKVKVTKVLPSRSDCDLFFGKVDRKYPIVPCHMAVGVISDNRPELGFKRGMKVILNPYTVSHPDRIDIKPEVSVAGYTTDGFLADFVLLPADNIIPFPEDVKEDEAIFTEYVSIALSAINCFRVEKGDYIAIIGASPLCNLIAQFALYFQAIPIVIGNDPVCLQHAEECGVYYTINSAMEVPYDRVMEITGGRMAEHTILQSDSPDPQLIFSLARHGGDCTIVSVNPYLNRVETDINIINNKQLKVKGISNGASEFNSAVYIIAQKSVNLEPLLEETIAFDRPDEIFNELPSKSMAVILTL